jgi:small subunit ribosomal protein S1
MPSFQVQVTLANSHQAFKCLEPSPWQRAEEVLSAGQLTSGVVTGIADFGAFVTLDGLGIEGLIHLSELAYPTPSHPTEVVQKCERLPVRVIGVDLFQQQISLSLRSVTEWEYDEWQAQQSVDATGMQAMESSDDSMHSELRAPETGRQAALANNGKSG